MMFVVENPREVAILSTNCFRSIDRVAAFLLPYNHIHEEAARDKAIMHFYSMAVA